MSFIKYNGSLNAIDKTLLNEILLLGRILFGAYSEIILFVNVRQVNYNVSSTAFSFMVVTRYSMIIHCSSFRR
jgi:hypothetical protein